MCTCTSRAGETIQREASRAVIWKGAEYVSPYLMDPSMKYIYFYIPVTSQCADIEEVSIIPHI